MSGLLDRITQKFKNTSDPFIDRVKKLGRIGEDFNFQQEGTLSYMTGQGYGLIGMESGSVAIPTEMMAFVTAKFKQYGIPYPEEMHNFSEHISSAALHYIDMWDGHFPLGYSDLKESSDWMNYTYKITNTNLYGIHAEPSLLANPEKLEVFKSDPGQDASWYEEFSKEAPSYAMFIYHSSTYVDNEGTFQNGGTIDDFLDLENGYFGEHLFYNIEEDGDLLEVIRKVCQKGDGSSNVSAYIEMGVCSALMWFCSPLGKEWRDENHELFYCANKHGEVICYDECIFTPNDFEKIPLSPSACHLCGLDAYCVDMVQGVAESVIDVCNGCLSKNRPPLPNATCGSKFCKHIECPHNKYNATGRSGYFSMMREEGQGLLGMNKRQQYIDRPQLGPSPEHSRDMLG